MTDRWLTTVTSARTRISFGRRLLKYFHFQQNATEVITSAALAPSYTPTNVPKLVDHLIIKTGNTVSHLSVHFLFKLCYVPLCKVALASL